MWSNSTGDVDRKIDRCGLTVQVMWIGRLTGVV